MAAILKVSQDRILRLERRTDLLISTLQRHVAAMGGNLSLVAEFPDGEPIILAGLANMDAEQPSPTCREARCRGKMHRSKTTDIPDNQSQGYISVFKSKLSG